jgi:hypothetical protein
MAIGILVCSLLLSELANRMRQRLRAGAPRDLVAAAASMANHLAIDGLGLLVGSVTYYALGGTTPLMSASPQWLDGFTPIYALAVLALKRLISP